ncbi:hypothetical protein [Oryzihumus leptocrescens]|uniref:Uncharacterized protein n=1 Tax=Oryzihumus leptocrescens TaxID=297536 RepID=A0A542ZEP9_9MICO|nr:hypothetical protein [Oryzihumus leptocrescens]TQL58740.1 hypothetical protein FB474_0076 [Oryzihumus leptocrescens]
MTIPTDLSADDALAFLRGLGAGLDPALLTDVTRTAPATLAVDLECHCGIGADDILDAFGYPPGGCFWGRRVDDYTDVPDLDLYTAPRLWQALDQRDAATDQRYYLTPEGTHLVEWPGAITQRMSSRSRWGDIPCSLWLTALVTAHAATQHLSDYRVEAWVLRSLTAIRISWAGREAWYIQTDQWLDEGGKPWDD